MKLQVPAAPFAFAWRAVWPAASTIPEGWPFWRSVVVETYPELDLLHLWATDSSMMLRAVAPMTLRDDDDPWVHSPQTWQDLRESSPDQQVIAHDAPKHVMVLAKQALALSKDNDQLEVSLTVGRREAPARGQAALGAALEPKQAVIETDGIRVECYAVDGTPPDWRSVEPYLDLGARVKRIGFSAQRLKRLASVPGIADLRITFTSSTGAALVDFLTAGAALAPVRGLLMPVRHVGDDPDGSGTRSPHTPAEYHGDTGTDDDDPLGDVTIMSTDAKGNVVDLTDAFRSWTREGLDDPPDGFDDKQLAAGEGRDDTDEDEDEWGDDDDGD